MSHDDAIERAGQIAERVRVEHGSLRDVAQITLAVILISAAYLGPIIAFGG